MRILMFFCLETEPVWPLLGGLPSNSVPTKKRQGASWTSDVSRSFRVSDALQAGMVWVNSENVRHLPAPFGGVENSGIGKDGGDGSFDF